MVSDIGARRSDLRGAGEAEDGALVRAVAGAARMCDVTLAARTENVLGSGIACGRVVDACVAPFMGA